MTGRQSLDSIVATGGPSRPALVVDGGARSGAWVEGVGRNPGMALDLDVVRAIRVNRSAAERRAATLPTRRTVKKEWQAAWLLRAITVMDLTTLSGDDTPGSVRRLCAKARHPVRADILEALGASALDVRVGAICVYHSLVPVAVAYALAEDPGFLWPRSRPDFRRA